jgi:cytoskeletal protein RodZ
MKKLTKSMNHLIVLFLVAGVVSVLTGISSIYPVQAQNKRTPSTTNLPSGTTESTTTTAGTTTTDSSSTSTTNTSGSTVSITDAIGRKYSGELAHLMSTTATGIKVIVQLSGPESIAMQTFLRRTDVSLQLRLTNFPVLFLRVSASALTELVCFEGVLRLSH